MSCFNKEKWLTLPNFSGIREIKHLTCYHRKMIDFLVVTVTPPSCLVTPVFDYFPITAHPVMYYFLTCLIAYRFLMNSGGSSVVPASRNPFNNYSFSKSLNRMQTHDWEHFYLKQLTQKWCDSEKKYSTKVNPALTGAHKSFQSVVLKVESANVYSQELRSCILFFFTFNHTIIQCWRLLSKLLWLVFIYCS